MGDKVRVRFAPSPTGNLHIGTARTALFNWLFARHEQGAFILRIEDTDRDRSTEQHEASILEDLAWLGITWDEGPDVGGSHGPYRQTERLAAGCYERAMERLIDGGQVYECYCTREELRKEREKALSRRETPGYGGRCRDLRAEEREALVREGRSPAWRFAVADGRTISFPDMIRGTMEFSSDVIGDFIIRRENGVPTYNFAAAVDDAQMDITHVVRGEDHLTNTVRQLLIFEALGEAPPVYVHLSMILGPDKAKLSKRHGATSVGEYREAGFLPEALVNNLALLSWSDESGEELMKPEVLQRQFSLARVSKSPPIFDGEKLRWFNAQYIRNMDPAELVGLVHPYLPSEWSADLTQNGGDDRLRRIIEAVQTGMETLSDITACAKIFFSIEYDDDTAVRLVTPTATEIRRAMAASLRGLGDLTIEGSKELVAKVKKDMIGRGHKPKEVFQTLRLALTGQLSGPELFYMPYALGPAECRRRLEIAK